jgi:hypothetical protein
MITDALVSASLILQPGTQPDLQGLTATVSAFQVPAMLCVLEDAWAKHTKVCILFVNWTYDTFVFGTKKSPGL